MPKLTFKQGVVIGVIGGTRAQRIFEKEMLDILGKFAEKSDEAFSLGDLGGEVLSRIQKGLEGKEIPLFPEGIPAEAYVAFDEIIICLTSANLLPV